jgi:hypothetical protein
MPAAGGEVREDILTLLVNIHARTYTRKAKYTELYLISSELFIARQSNRKMNILFMIYV